jgi:single-strand DNA-binding protein
MTNDLNSFLVSGVVLEKPDFVTAAPGAAPVCTFPIASARPRYSKEKAPMAPTVTALTIRATGKLALYANANIQKGQPVRVVGRIQQRLLKDGDGPALPTVFVAAEHIEKNKNRDGPDLNSLILEGNITKEPEFGKTETGVLFCNLRIASNRFFKDDTRLKRETIFFTIKARSKQAEIFYNNNASKNRGVRIVGSVERQNHTIFIIPDLVEIKRERGRESRCESPGANTETIKPPVKKQPYLFDISD